MPVSHIGLTVTHLPTSTSFYLSALAPLGYKFIAEHGSQIGFGPAHSNEADFFITQEGNGVKASAAHVAFLAPSLRSVDRFYSAALRAGGLSNGSPEMRGNGWYNAAVLDFDGNSVEVVHRSPSPFDRNKALNWREKNDCASIIHDHEDRAGLVSHRSHGRAPQSVASSYSSRDPPLITITEENRSISHFPSHDSKELIGTLLGAAAGAAVAYAMVKSERSGTADEAAFSNINSGGRHPSGTTTIMRQVLRVIEAAPTIPAPSARSTRSLTSAASSRRVRSLSPPPPSIASRQLEYPMDDSRSIVSSMRSSSRPKAGRRAITAGPARVESIFDDNANCKENRSTLIDTFCPPTEVLRVLPEYECLAPTTAQKKAGSLANSRPRSTKSSAPSSKTSIVTAREILLPTSTVAPLSVVALSQHNYATRAGGCASRQGQGDLSTLAPSDSISCAGSKHSERHGSRCSRSSKHPSRHSERRAASKASSSRTVRNVGAGAAAAAGRGDGCCEEAEKRSEISVARTLPIRPNSGGGSGASMLGAGERGNLAGARSLVVESREGERRRR